MYKDGRYINAGEVEFYRWGHKAIDKVKAYLEPNENGFYSIPADGGKYWTFGTSVGKYGEFAKYKDTFLSVNKDGYIYAKEGTEKADAFRDMLNGLIESMKEHHAETCKQVEEEEEE